MTITQVFNITMEMWGLIFCLVAATTISLSGFRDESEKKLARMEYLVMILLAMDVLAWYFRGRITSFGIVMTRFSNFSVYLCNFLLIISFAEYLLCFVADSESKLAKAYLWSSRALTLLGMLCLVVNCFTGLIYSFDENNCYYRGPYAMTSWVIGGVAILFSFIILLLSHADFTTARFFSLMTYLFLPLIAVAIQSKLYGLSLVNITYSVVIIIIFFVNVVERGKELAEQQKHMNEMQTKIMLSQIQPHFLYNSLTAIYYLCDIDPKTAKDAVSHFSQYLRTNMDSLKEMNPVSFSKEMDHVENYLSLEKLRFEEELEITYEIEATDFELPALTVQPIVENAVKYGVGKKQGGGTVKISSRHEKGYFVIEVVDDGAGYDVNETKDDGRTHIGIDNVRQRLQSMVNGSLDIHSELGKGTHAVIRIPDTHRVAN